MEQELDQKPYKVIDTAAREDKPVLWRPGRWWSLVKLG